jgi:hypothetical protein
MQNVATEASPTQAFDPDRPTIFWCDAGVQWQEDEDNSSRVAWVLVDDPDRFAEFFPGVDAQNLRAVACAVEAADVPLMAIDQSMRREDWLGELAYDGGLC